MFLFLSKISDHIQHDPSFHFSFFSYFIFFSKTSSLFILQFFDHFSEIKRGFLCASSHSRNHEKGNNVFGFSPRTFFIFPLFGKINFEEMVNLNLKSIVRRINSSSSSSSSSKLKYRSLSSTLVVSCFSCTHLNL